MTKFDKMAKFTNAGPEKETPLDKTARIVRRMAEDDAEVRHLKTERLRKARIEGDEEVDVDVTSAPSGTSKTAG
jgi:hypothetical protein